MAARLETNRYGKAETRVVRLDRGPDRHGIRDLNVSVTLAGDLDDTHMTGDNAKVLPTDSQKNTVYAFARDGIGSPETFATRLARHFVDSFASITHASVDITEYHWSRLGDHSFSRGRQSEARTAQVDYDGASAAVSAGIADLLLLNTTNSEFTGYITDSYTTLPETGDRILATEVAARWSYGAGAEDDYEARYTAARQALIAAFCDTYSLSLQQTLYALGQRVIDQVATVERVELSLPNKHHYLFDLERFGLDNPGVVFQVGDRPYGLIQGTVARS